jgi:DNA-binding LacI/PurR family transcriptional regulator
MTLMADEPDAIVCANDRTAGLIMQALLAQGYTIPGDVRLVGIDDVQYASLLPVPLTTLRQPCRDIGVAAMAAMLDRIAQPDLPARDILLHPTLIVRRSCGGITSAGPQQGTALPGRIERLSE